MQFWRRSVINSNYLWSPSWRSTICGRNVRQLETYKDERFTYEPLAEMLGMNKTVLKKTVSKYKIHQSVSKEEIHKNIILLLDWGLSKSYINDYIHLLCVPHSVLKNRLQICQECGCLKDKIGPVILNLHQFFSIEIRLLKAYEILPDEHDIVNHILTSVDISELELPIQTKDFNTVGDIYNKIYMYYLYKEVSHVMQPVPLKMTVSKKFSPSIKNFIKNVDLMKRKFKFDAYQFKKNRRILSADPDNILAVMKSIQGINIMELAPKYPELLVVLPEKFQKIYNIIKEHNIDFLPFLRNPILFSMNYSDFEYRLIGCLNSKFLRVFKNHPRLPELIARSRIANERLHILAAFKMKCYNVNVLIGSTEQFLRYVTVGVDEVNPADTFLYVSQELQKPIEKIRLQLSKNPFIKYIPILTVKDNLEYLHKLGFDNDDIFYCVQILLYPKETVEKKVIQIHTGEISVKKFDMDIPIRKKFYLPLALYFIEKAHNFTESALWQNNDNTDQATKEHVETNWNLSG